jgi:hypothetical protein
MRNEERTVEDQNDKEGILRIYPTLPSIDLGGAGAHPSVSYPARAERGLRGRSPAGSEALPGGYFSEEA